MKYESHHTQSLREAFGEALAEFGKTYDDLRVLDAGTSNSTMSESFRKAYPERFYTPGINEPGMIALATGLAMTGKRVVACDMSIFLQHAHAQTLTAARQGEGLHLIIGASHTGIAVGPDGGSAHDVTDIARMRLIPGYTVLSPWDGAQVRKVLEVILATPGYYYVRLNRPKIPLFLKDPVPFEIGKAYRLTEGSKVTIVASGEKVWTALKVAEELGEGVAEVIGIVSFEPFDRQTLIESARRTGKVVTLEDHIPQGGLFETCAGVLAEEYPTPMRKVAVPRVFTTSGEPEELARMYGVDQEALMNTVRSFIA
jgi:transketolase